jgi:hypothetical protein
VSWSTSNKIRKKEVKQECTKSDDRERKTKENVAQNTFGCRRTSDDDINLQKRWSGSFSFFIPAGTPCQQNVFSRKGMLERDGGIGVTPMSIPNAG